MARLGDQLHAIRRQCNSDRGHAKPIINIAHRRPSPQLVSLREGVTRLVFEALRAGVNPNTVLQNCGIAIDEAAALAQVQIEAIR